jgi:hypothetical protein
VKYLFVVVVVDMVIIWMISFINRKIEKLLSCDLVNILNEKNSLQAVFFFSYFIISKILFELVNKNK